MIDALQAGGLVSFMVATLLALVLVEAAAELSINRRAPGWLVMFIGGALGFGLARVIA